MKRPIHTMTPDEFNEWTKGTLGGNLGSGAGDRVRLMTESLYSFFNFLSFYGNFDSITWLIDHDFDLNFTEARKDQHARL